MLSLAYKWARTSTSSGTDPAKQVAMGLHGALIVASGVANQAYGPATSFNIQATLVLSEIDPNLHANPLAFDMQNYAPTYWLVNGKAHPQTLPIQANAGQTRMAALRESQLHPSHHGACLACTNASLPGMPLRCPP